MKPRKFIKPIGIVFGAIMLVLLLIVGVRYVFCPIYHFPEPQPFSGDQWYNPYANLNQRWFQANFHVHSKMWLGLTNGRNSAEEIHQHYRSLGYDIVCISDYQYINAERNMGIERFPVYEHGVNIGKTHQVVLGARQVDWLDYFFLQNRNHKQHVINTLKKHADFVILAHPVLYNGYTREDMKWLTGYDAVEVLNHFRFSVDRWDEALSAGKAVWVFGGDDSHNISYRSETGVNWTMIHARSPKRIHILKALRKGRHYAVAGYGGVNHNRLKIMKIKSNFLKVTCESPADQIRFIGQGGKMRKEVKNSPEAVIELQPHDTYIRAEIFSGGGKLYLNPVIRYDGKSLPLGKVEIDLTATWIQRVLIILFLALLVYGAVRLRRNEETKKRRNGEEEMVKS